MAANELAQLAEEMRNDQMKAMWQRFGGLLVLAVIAIIIGTAAWSGWNWWNGRQQEQHSYELAQALKLDTIEKRIAALSKLSETSVAAPAQLALVGEAVASNDRAKMADAVARMEEADLPAYYHELAIILEGRLALDGDEKDAAAAIAKLEILAQDTKSAWQKDAALYVAILKIRSADEVKEIKEIAAAGKKVLAGDKDKLEQLRHIENLYLAARAE